MLDFDAPNLSPDSGKRNSISPDADAKARALAVETGAKWKCSRVNAWVDVTDCIARYVVAQDARPAHSPCLECSSIAAHVRKIGGIPEPQPQQKEPAMPVAAKKLEVVQPSNPFAGWEKFDTKDRFRAGRSAFVTLTKSHVLTFSTLAGEQLDLMRFASVDVYANNDKLGLHFREDADGQLCLTRHKAKQGGVNLNISARGITKHFGLEYLAGKHLPLSELAPGFVEIDLAREVGS